MDVRRTERVRLVVLLLAVGCSPNRPLTPAARGGGGAGGGGEVTQSIAEAPDQMLDMLVVIDDGPGARSAQQKLASNFPAFLGTLQALPRGGPDLHVGVTSTNLGAGAFNLPGCPAGGDGGRLLAGRGGACHLTVRDDYLAVAPDGTARNFDGPLADAFSCLADLGESGCAFGQPLAAAALALGVGGPMPPENQGFLRPEASLFILVVTDRDDCSVPADSTLFDPSSRRLADPLGPLTSYRCAEFGYLCAGAPPPRAMARTFPEGACVSAEGQGRLAPVATLVRQIASLKADADRARLFVATIGGPRDPFSVALAPAPAGADAIGVLWPSAGPSCAMVDGESASPAVRLRAFSDAFQRNGLFQSFCVNSWTPLLAGVAGALYTPRPLCLDAALLDASGTTLGAGCSVVEGVPVADDQDDQLVETPVPACTAGTEACWTVEASDACPASGAAIAVGHPGGGLAEPGSRLTVRCPR